MMPELLTYKTHIQLSTGRPMGSVQSLNLDLEVEALYRVQAEAAADVRGGLSRP